jgi:hypothetical protein
MMRIASAGKENGQSKRQKGILWQQTLDEELFSPLAPLKVSSRKIHSTVENLRHLA